METEEDPRTTAGALVYFLNTLLLAALAFLAYMATKKSDNKLSEKSQAPTKVAATAGTNTEAMTPCTEDASSQTDSAVFISLWACDNCATQWRAVNAYDEYISAQRRFGKRYRTELKLEVSKGAANKFNPVEKEFKI